MNDNKTDYDITDNETAYDITDNKTDYDSKCNHNSSFLTLNSKLSIARWAKEDRPREKMAELGAEALSNAELLAILIGSGSTDDSAVDLMKKVLADCLARRPSTT